jgi:hypothetical protein
MGQYGHNSTHLGFQNSLCCEALAFRRKNIFEEIGAAPSGDIPANSVSEPQQEVPLSF